MSRTLRYLPLLTVAALAASLAAGPALAQSLPPQPVPVGPPSTGLTPPPALTPPPSPLDAAPLPVYRDPLPSHDTLLDPSWTPPGWFAAVEADIVKPHFKNGIVGNVFFPDGTYDVVHVPGTAIDWTVAPRFELGYRFADGFGEILLSYRNLSSDGHALVPDYDAAGDDGQLRSRLDLNVLDLEYASHDISLGSRLDLKWRAGVRLVDVFYDTHVFGQFVDQRVNNSFTGAGPLAGLDLWYHFSVPGLGLFARVEGALPIGRVHQGFEESWVQDDGTVFGGAGAQSRTQVVPTLNLQAGVGWQPPGTRLRFTSGYQFEQWWNLGHVGASGANLFDQGAFLRAEFGF